MKAKERARRQKRRRHAAEQSRKQRSDGMRHALAELQEEVDAGRLVEVEDLHAGQGQLRIRLRFPTQGIPVARNGLPIASDYEDIILAFLDSYPDAPPLVHVDHLRFAEYPHVLVGTILCIYLDPAREWHPALGAAAVAGRISEWLEDAAAARFDARTALFHAVGGLPPSPRIGQTIVVGDSPSTSEPGVSIARMRRRTDRRLDLLSWRRRSGVRRADDFEALSVRTNHAMPFGLVGAERLSNAIRAVELAGGPAGGSLTQAIARRLQTLPTDEHMFTVLQIPHPTDTRLLHLEAFVIHAAVADNLRGLAPDQWPVTEIPIGWATMSDTRPETSTRRDSARPTAAFVDKSVEIWGCGGIGSWLAEFIVRAGASRIILRDPGAVTSGLLVRQNYTEADVGSSKADQLGDRLRLLSDQLEVETHVGSVLDVLNTDLATPADILIDATINLTVGARLDEWARSASDHPTIAQVAVDPGTATRALVVIAPEGSAFGPATVDDATWREISERADLERFHGFWNELHTSEQLVPATGCSTPTFHGSAADLASISGSVVTILGGHIRSPLAGAHLVEAAHASGVLGGGQLFVPHAEPGTSTSAKDIE